MKHLTENNETYLSHMLFALKISVHLFFRSFSFLFHAFCPFVNIPETLTLSATCKLINKWEKLSQERKKNQ